MPALGQSPKGRITFQVRELTSILNVNFIHLHFFPFFLFSEKLFDLEFTENSTLQDPINSVWSLFNWHVLIHLTHITLILSTYRILELCFEFEFWIWIWIIRRCGWNNTLCSQTLRNNFVRDNVRRSSSFCRYCGTKLNYPFSELYFAVNCLRSEERRVGKECSS